MRHKARMAGIAATLMLLVVPALVAQTTGRITGQATDASGAAVPGVIVTVTSPQLQGSQSTTSDGTGNFRIFNLPPGTYLVRAALTGFKTVEQPNVVVSLDRTVNLALKMEVAAVVETVEVTGGSPVLDVGSTTTGVNVTADLFKRIPLGRGIYEVARVAPGTQDDGVGTTFSGSTGAENQYIIEGLNVTGVERAEEIKRLNFDFVQEIEVKTGGLSAEYGRMTGGVINVLTKSGGNEFHGSIFGFNEGGGLQSDDNTDADRPVTTTTVENVDKRWDIGGELGGYLVKDKLWFFGAYNRVSQTDERRIIRDLRAPGAPAQGSRVPRETTRNLFAGKLTWRLSEDHTLTASAFGDPTKREGYLFAIQGAENTWKGEEDSGSTDLVGRYDGVFGPTFLVRAMVGRHFEKIELGGAGKAIPLLWDQRVSPNIRTGGFSFFQDSEFTRWVYKMDLTKFAGGHEFKLGGDYEDIEGDISRNYGGGQLIYALTRSGVTVYRHRYFVDVEAPGFDRANPATWVIANPLSAKVPTRNIGGYIQDSWKIAKNFTLNAGLRWEHQRLRDHTGGDKIKLNDNWAPRVGFVWDVAGNGKSKLYGNWGRFYESIPQDINIRSFGLEVLCFCYNFNPSPAALRPDPSAPLRSSILGGHSTPVDPDLKGQYLDEWLGGFEYEVAPNFALGIKGAYRNLGRVIEDFLVVEEGDYFIANPGERVGENVTFFDYSTAPAPKAERKSYSVELTARKRFSDNWQLLASYVWSKLEGNYDGLFQNSSGQLDPNINSAFDYADFLVNADGRLSVDRRHQLKLDGSYQFAGAVDGLNVGASFRLQSGIPQNAYGYSFAYANHEYFLAPRGSLGRHPTDWEGDLHVSYPIKVGEKAKLNVIVDVFNLFDRQTIIQYDERYNLPEHGPCGGVPAALCNGDGGLLNRPGTVEPAGSISNPRATAPNPDFLRKGIAFTDQRSIRLGARFTF